ncbi:MerC domain-containing protein [Altererythrobacter sp. ZODW24]|uniref:MerC domain-containing protein n=1 Tax=Altererythrobacter sp. ZODW24 TaxID=2185142 RepID=UPI001F074CCF|nr:MerC domain-containing protein [Altererythrobacter sp. ZODW24]
MSQAMLPSNSRPVRHWLDRAGVVLSALCAAHCVAGLALVALAGASGGIFFAPAFHEAGLAIAVLIGGLAVGMGAIRHRRAAPIMLGVAGLALMASALTVEHGLLEAVLTIAGVALVAAAHITNLRSA